MVGIVSAVAVGLDSNVVMMVAAYEFCGTDIAVAAVGFVADLFQASPVEQHDVGNKSTGHRLEVAGDGLKGTEMGHNNKPADWK